MDYTAKSEIGKVKRIWRKRLLPISKSYFRILMGRPFVYKPSVQGKCISPSVSPDNGGGGDGETSHAEYK